jgi:glucosamine 6-phosphate synthetase-like amidotransferase/phosphosugar isomerase protein
MCQLAAYIGDRDITKTLLNCLKYQEAYFGANATGMGTIDKGGLKWLKEPGSVDQVIRNSEIMGLTGTTGLAHSRLSLTDDPRYNRAKNAHPFINADDNIALMHNGIINNYKEHWAELAKEYEFRGYNSDIDYITDSEVAVHMVDKKVKEGQSFEDAMRETANNLTGMVLLAAMSPNEPETIYITNWIQACTLAKGDGETMFSSSHLGFAEVQDDMDFFHAPRNSFIKMTRDRIEITKLDPSRASNPHLYMCVFREVITELLKKGAMTSVEIDIELGESGGERVFGMDEADWKELVKVGWGDQNQIIDSLEQLVKEGSVVRRLEQRMEGGNHVPRFVWSLS